MDLNNFIDEQELRIISFTYFLVQEIETKIETKVIYYRAQIDRYLEQQVGLFLRDISANLSLKSVYKRQILSNVHFKLKRVFNSQPLLNCI